MSNNERRIVLRKAYAMPIRFNVISQELAAVGLRAMMGMPRGASKYLETMPLLQQGETVNLSERGIRWKTRHGLSVGESVELFFTLPRELSGRKGGREVQCAPGSCGSRAAHVRPHQRRRASECFERTSVARNWVHLGAGWLRATWRGATPR